MPLEIKELEIRMRIADDKDVAAPSPAANHGECASPTQNVAENVSRVLQALRDLEDR